MKRIISPKLKLLLDEFGQDKFLREQFYFTGGTALSLFYLQHRESVDLDFFSEKRVAPEHIINAVGVWQRKHNLESRYFSTDITHVFNLKFPDGEEVKVDFSYYPFRKMEREKMEGLIKVDSLKDIAVNKLLTMEQRTAVKDFVDLYFLFNEFTLWDLIDGVRYKFNMKLELFIIASDFLKVHSFDQLPKMLKPLTLAELKIFFDNKAKQIGKRAVK